MDSFNKVISFVLGLVVVIVFFAVVTGKINFGGGLPSFSKESGTPTTTQSPTPSQKSVSKITVAPTSGYGQYDTKGAVKTIPSTGLPTIFIPAMIAGLIGGASLTRVGKK